MGFYIDYAARVGNHINHRSESGRIGLAVIGIVVGVAIVLGSGGTLTVLVVAGAAATGGSVGMTTGGVVDEYMLPADVNPAHFIGTGVDSLRLGIGIWPAARAQSEDTKDAMDGMTMEEGSKTVVVGPDFKPLV